MGLMALCNGPWTLPLDRDILATHYGEVRRTFRHHVRPTRRQIHPLLGSFTQFLQLPLELQQHILSFCDSATLFQLMHVSSTTRDEAKKLFWSEPTTRYYIRGFWPLAGGYIGHTSDDVEALALMQHIEIDFRGMPSILFAGWDDGELEWVDPDRKDIPNDSVDQVIAMFWETLRLRFPRVTHVVLSDTALDDPGAPPPNELVQLAHGSPASIAVAISSLNRESRHPQVSRYLWQQVRCDGSPTTWELVDSAWTPRRVFPPLNVFSGPVGLYRRLHKLEEIYIGMLGARPLLSYQATEAYYLHIRRGPCVCPFPKCGRQFELPGLWTAHIIEVAHDDVHEGEVPPPPCETLRSLLERHTSSMVLLNQRMAEERSRMEAAWGAEGSQQRTDATREFLQQLLHDPLYARQKAPEESFIWGQYQLSMEKENIYDE
jgi:hypothetical protein